MSLSLCHSMSSSWVVNLNCFRHILAKIFVVSCYNGIQSSVGVRHSYIYYFFVSSIHYCTGLIVLILIFIKDNLMNNNIKEPIRETSSLQEIFPAMYGEEYRDLLVMDRTVDIYLQCLGVRGALRMGNTQFRNFTRYG